MKRLLLSLLMACMMGLFLVGCGSVNFSYGGEKTYYGELPNGERVELTEEEAMEIQEFQDSIPADELEKMRESFGY